MTWMRKAAGSAAAIMALTALAASTCAQTPAALQEGVVAVVNDNIVSSYDVGQRIRLIVVTSGVQPTEQTRPQIEQEAVRELIDERLEVAEVLRVEKEQKFKILADDNDVNARIDEVAQQSFHMSGAQFVNALVTAGIDPRTFRDQIRAQMSWERWMSGRFGGTRMKISAAQINGAIAAYEAAAAQPQYLLGEIFLDATQAGGMQAADTAAQQLVTQLQQGAPFNGVARQFSSAPTAATGGDTGWLNAANLPAEIRPVVEQMHPGELSKPIDAQNGVYIILLRDKHAGAASQVVDLKQAAIMLAPDAAPDVVAAAQRKLMALKAQFNGCDALGAKASKFDGVVAGDLGETDVKDLKAEFRDVALKLNVGQISDPIRTGAGLHLIAVCGRRDAGVDVPSRDQIEASLRQQQISLISKRELRDLRNSATIEFP